MSYQTNLTWLSKMGSFSTEQQKILLALSDDRYKWRAKDRLATVTALEPAKLDDALAQLIRNDVVRPSLSKKSSIIFGLRERVDPK